MSAADARSPSDRGPHSPAQSADATSLTLCFQYVSLRGLLSAARCCVAWHSAASSLPHRIRGADWIAAEERGALDGAADSGSDPAASDQSTGLTLSVFPSPQCKCCLEGAEEPGAKPHVLQAFRVMQQEDRDRPAFTSLEQVTASRLLCSLRKLTLSPSPSLVARQSRMLRDLRTANPAERLAIERHKTTFGAWDAQFKRLPSLQSLISLRIDLFTEASFFAPKIIARVFAALARTPPAKEDAPAIPAPAAASSSSAPAAPAPFVPSPNASPLRVLRLLGKGSSHISAFLTFLPLLGSCLRVLELGDTWLAADEALWEETLPRMHVLHTLRLAPRVRKTARRLAALRRAPALTTVTWPTDWTCAHLDALTLPQPPAAAAAAGEEDAAPIEWLPPLRLRSLRVEHATLLSSHLAALTDLEELFAVQTGLGAFGPIADQQIASADSSDQPLRMQESVAEVAAALPKRLVTLHLCTEALSPLCVAAVAAARCSAMQVLHLASSSLRLDERQFAALCSSLPALRELQLASMVLRSLHPLTLLASTLRSLSLYEILLFDQSSWSALGTLRSLQSLLVESHVTAEHARRQLEMHARASRDGPDALSSLQRTRDAEWRDPSADELRQRLADQLEWMDEDPQRTIRGLLSEILSGEILSGGGRGTVELRAAGLSDASASASASSSSAAVAAGVSPVCPLLSRWSFNGSTVRNPCEAEAWRPIPVRSMPLGRGRLIPDPQISEWAGVQDSEACADLFS